MTKEPKAAIYGLRCVCGCPGEIRYVGQTIQPLPTRLTNHRSMARYGIQTAVYHWMRKHSVENIRIELLESPPLEEIHSREVHWISTLPNLLNISPGGEGGTYRGKKRPEHSVKVRGENHYGAKLTEADVLTMRREHTGKYGELTRFAKQYGVSVNVVHDVVNRKTWKHI